MDTRTTEELIESLTISYVTREDVTEAVQELRRLLRWKKEAIEVLEGWEHVWNVAGRPGPLGRPKHENVAYELIRLQGNQRS